MAASGQFPKANGDILYAQDVNFIVDAYNTGLFSSLSVGSPSSSLDITGVLGCSTIIMENVGDSKLFFRFAADAVADDFPLDVGKKITFTNVSFDRIDAISDGGTTKLNVIVKGISGDDGIYDEHEILTLLGSNINNSESFTNTTSYKDVLITNIGNKDVYIALGSDATTNSFLLPSDKVIYVGNTNISSISAICGSTDTTTIKILGVY